MITESITLKRYLDEISDIPVLSRAEETTLIPAAQAGDEKAHEKVIRSNLRYVVTIANEYRERGFPMMDIISEGNLGLFRALESFDSTRGIRFITYAKWWIRQCIVYALIYKSHVVRIPQSQLRKLRNMKKARENEGSGEVDFSTGRLGASPSEEEQLPSLVDCLVYQQSLEQPCGEDGNNRLIDFVPNKDSIAPDHFSNRASFETDLKHAFSLLKKREVDILKMLFGLYDDKATLGDVSAKYGISRERARQIKNNALNKLSGSRKVRAALVDYLY